MPFSEWNQHTLEDLKKAIQQALEQGQLFDDETLQEMMERLQQHDAGADGPAARQPGAEDGRRRADHHRGAGRAAGRRGRARATARTAKVQVRSDRQVARLPGLQDAEGPAGIAREIELRPARYARPGHRHRSLGLVQAVRIRRHAEPGCQRDAVFGHPARGRQGAARHGVRRPARAPVRIPKLLRHGADAGLQPQHDPLWRGPLHAGQESGAGAGAPDPHAVSRRQPALRAVPRYRRGTGASASWRACRWARTTPTRATA